MKIFRDRLELINFLIIVARTEGLGARLDEFRWGRYRWDWFEMATDNVIAFAQENSPDDFEVYGSDWSKVLKDVKNEKFESYFPTIYKLSNAGILQIAHHLIERTPRFAEIYRHFRGVHLPMTYEELSYRPHSKLNRATQRIAKNIDKQLWHRRFEVDEYTRTIDYTQRKQLNVDACLREWGQKPLRFTELHVEEVKMAEPGPRRSHPFHATSWEHMWWNRLK